MSVADIGASDSSSSSAADLRTFKAFAEAVAGDFEMIAHLHDREPGLAIIEALQQCPFHQQLGLLLTSDAALAALSAFELAVGQLPKPANQLAIDELAAGYADVYLRHTYRAAPTESVWLTEDGLERQAPMFLIRDFYRKHNLVVTDWANRPDDHIVLQMRFLAHLFANAETPDDVAAAAGFLDAHLLRWVKRHAIRLVQADAPDFYTALSLLTACYAEEVRDHLTAITGIERPRMAPEPTHAEKARAEAAMPYIPGVAPSW